MANTEEKDIPAHTEAFIDTVEATGGVVYKEGALEGCAGDEYWLDLARAYVAACEYHGREPKVAGDEEE